MIGKLKKRIWAALCDTRGTTAIEYAFLISLIGIAAVGGFTQFANEMSGLYNYISESYVGAQ